MILYLKRDTLGPISSQGSLWLNGAKYCDTLERPWLNNQPQVSCIPEGAYDIVIEFSPHFSRRMPHLLNVPQRSGILIHPANWVSQLQGCIAVGMEHGQDFVSHSEAAFAPLFQDIQEAEDKGEQVRIVITSPVLS